MILDFTDELVNGVLKKGYLTKEGHLRRNWKRRYFILQENIMRYYASRETMHLKVRMCNCVYVTTSVYRNTLAEANLSLHCFSNSEFL